MLNYTKEEFSCVNLPFLSNSGAFYWHIYRPAWFGYILSCVWNADGVNMNNVNNIFSWCHIGAVCVKLSEASKVRPIWKW